MTMCWTYLARAGINKEQVARGGYLIRTTLDPKVQASVKQAIDKVASPTLGRGRQRDERDQAR